jgi:hypothetical protein
LVDLFKQRPQDSGSPLLASGGLLTKCRTSLRCSHPATTVEGAGHMWASGRVT